MHGGRVYRHRGRSANGRTDDPRRILRTLEQRFDATGGGSGEIAQVYIGLSEFDRAFAWLARAVEDGSGSTLRVAVVWDPLRSDPRFARLLQDIGPAPPTP